MITKRTRVGDIDVLVEVIEGDTVEEDMIIQDDLKRRQTVQTGIGQTIRNAFDHASDTIIEIAKNVSTRLQQFDNNRPQLVELELSLALSGKSDIWVITSESKASIKVKLQWKQ